MVFPAQAWRSCDRRLLLAAESSHGRVVRDWLEVRQVAPVLRVPLLSQEGPTCRLLPGATAPFPALDQELTLTVAPADVFVLV